MDDPPHARAAPPPPMSPGLRTLGVVASGGLLALIAALPRLVPVDDWVWRTVLLLRGCETDALVDRVVDQATHLLTALFVIATVLHVRRHGGRSAWPWVSTVALGLFASKTLKHLLTRDRPSALPDVVLGYSFPSAHVMNSVAASIALVALARGLRRRELWTIGSSVLVTVVTAGRVVLGRHWACDVVGGGLAAFALIGILVPAIARRPVRGPILAALVLGVAFWFDQWLGHGGVRLPTPLVGATRALVDVGSSGRPELAGAWRETAKDQLVGPFYWMEGSATVAFELAPDDPVLAAGGALRLAVGGRTERPRRACKRLGFDLNGRPLPRFVPFEGWREYRLPIPPDALRAGRNALTIMADASTGPARFGVAYVRLATVSGTQ